jgi:xanthine/CO dehydrogenase XdhC/CoxF family maturation factor
MGTFIGARSHEEIAVSVVGELISVRRLGHDQAKSWELKQKSRSQTAVKDLPATECEAGS